MFVANQASFDRLMYILDTSKYTLVSEYLSGEVRGAFRQDGQVEFEVLQDSAIWLDLMSVANLETVWQRENFYIFIGEGSSVRGERFELPIYLYADENPLKSCKEKFKDIPCGMCDMFRKDGWTARYMWSSGGHLADYMEPLSPDNQLVESNHKCIEEGLVEMGNENISTLFE